MKKKIISLINNPKKVVIISLAIAICVGWFSYININKIQSINDLNNINSINQESVSLSFAVPGKIKSILVEEGNYVKRGDILATIEPDDMDGPLMQSQAAYDIAKANYQKIINGATGETVDVAKTAVKTAEINLNQITKQQDILVDNAYRNLLNSTPEALPEDGEKDYIAPVISGNYVLGKEGVIDLDFYYSSGGISYNISGLTNGFGLCNTINPQPIGDSGLFIKCSPNQIDVKEWQINIPNKKALNYITNLNAYELAVQTKNQAVNLAQATLDQAQANLVMVASNARPEDIAIAKAQVENALGVLKGSSGYNDTLIVAPFDGVVISIKADIGKEILSDEPIIILN